MGLLLKTSTFDKIMSAVNNPAVAKDVFKETENYSLPKPPGNPLVPLDNIEEFAIPAYQFSLEILGKTAAIFQKISGMSVTRSVEPLTEGGRNHHTLEFPGQVSYGHLTFETGLTTSQFFWNWMMDGQFAGSATSLNFSLKQYRPNPQGGSPAFEQAKNWNFYNGFPVNWKISELDLDDSKRIVIESLEISFDFFELS